jgi:hypothetical protein
MTSVAAVCWGLVFFEREGHAYATVSGPETASGTAPVPEGVSFVGIEFAVGTSLRVLPTPTLVGGGVELPDTTRRTFRLDGARWETPGPDDAEALVGRLVRAGAVVRDPLVTAVRRGERPAVTERTVERRFRAATGLTQGAVRQIERARLAARALAGGVPVADVVTGLEFFDEPHLARSLRRYVGRTAGELREGTGGPIALALGEREPTGGPVAPGGSARTGGAPAPGGREPTGGPIAPGGRERTRGAPAPVLASGQRTS